MELHHILMDTGESCYVNINDNFDDYTNEKKSEHNSKWPYIPDHPYRIVIAGGSG